MKLQLTLGESFAPDTGPYLRDRDGKKYLDFTSGGGCFPMGYDPIQTGDCQVFSTREDLERLSENISHLSGGHFSFYFFNEFSEALSFFSLQISDTFNRKSVVSFDRHVSSLMAGTFHFQPWNCGSCKEGPDITSCSKACLFHFDEFLDNWCETSSQTAVCGEYFRSTPLSLLPDAYPEHLHKENIFWAVWEPHQAFLRLGTLFSFENSASQPSMVLGGSNWANGLPFFLVGIPKNIGPRKLSRNNVLIPKVTLLQVEKNLMQLSSDELKDKINFFSNKLNRLKDCDIKSLNTLGMYAVIELKSDIVEKVLQKSTSFGIVFRWDRFRRGIVLSPPLTATTDEISQGVEILREILIKF
ncbi:MAG: hypothetical protein PHQ23_15385 [Candidatus Wallbacteria bacterium]|nr:hypothetical protein [Candidatus Wallbacteria bacterium]